MALVFKVFQPVMDALFPTRITENRIFSLVECTTDVRLLGGGSIDIGLLSFLQVLHARSNVAMLPVDFPLKSNS